MQQLDVYQLLSQHVSGIIMPIFRRTKTVLLHMVYYSGSAEQCSHSTTQRPTTATNHIQQNQSSTPYTEHGLCSPEDGHNDARNMLIQVDNKLLILATCWFLLSLSLTLSLLSLALSLHTLLTMHGHRNLNNATVFVICNRYCHNLVLSKC